MIAAARTYRGELLALTALALGILLLAMVGGRAVPIGIYGRGLVAAAMLALHAIGVVLVFRSDRFLNLAQVQIGALGGTLFAAVTQAAPLFRAVDAVCPPCLADPGPVAVWVNYLLGAVLGILLAVAVGWLLYVVVVRRLSGAARLVPTVASIFVVQLLAGLRDPLVARLVTDDQRALGIPGGSSLPPVDLSFRFGGATFTTADVMVVGAAVLAIAGLTAYLRWTAVGTAIRASASSRERAETLGINVTAVTGRVWLTVGALSGIAAVVTVMSSGEETLADGFNATLLVRILAVAIVARLVSLPLAGVAAVAFGVLDQVVLWVLGSTLLLDGILLLVIGGLLLAQRRERHRADEGGPAWAAARELPRIPAILRPLPEVRRYLRVGTLLLTISLLAVPWVMSPSQTNRITVAVIYAMVGMSLLLLTGWAGLVSLGQFAFAAVGAWAAAVLGLGLVSGLFVGAAVGALVAVVVGLPALRLRGLYLAVTTLALALSVTAVVLNERYLGALLPDELDRPSLLGFDLDDQRVSYYLALVVLAAATAAVVGLRRSRTGRILIGTRDNEPLASSVGVDVTRLRLTAFVLSGLIAAVAGVLFSYQQGGVEADAFAPEVSLDVFVFTVIGGFGSVAGPLLGFAAYALLSLFADDRTVLQLASGFGGVALVLAVPGGLAQLAHGGRDAVLRRIAKRRRLVVPSLVSDEADLERRAGIRPKLGRGGHPEFVPRRYGLDGQWLIAPDALEQPEEDGGPVPAGATPEAHR